MIVEAHLVWLSYPIRPNSSTTTGLPIEVLGRRCQGRKPYRLLVYDVLVDVISTPVSGWSVIPRLRLELDRLNINRVDLQVDLKVHPASPVVNVISAIVPGIWGPPLTADNGDEY